MNRRAFLTGLAASAAAQRTSKPMNIVLILADDLGWTDLGCYGADLHETPNLDRLAKEGVRFTDAHSASPVCSPTRAAIMTGKHPARLKITIWREGSLRTGANARLVQAESKPNLAHEETTIAEVLQSRGYMTGIVGKWHLGDGDFYPETQGFDINIGGTHWGAPETYFYPYRGEKAFREFRYMPGLFGGKKGEYLTDRLTDEALRVIDLAGNQPFFLYLAHHSPHTPIEAKPELIDHYKKKLKPGMNHQNATYAAMVHSLDESVGRVLKHLELRGHASNTAVIFMSDNGGFIGRAQNQVVTNNAPLRSGKGSVYEGGVRVPLIIRAPGAARGKECNVPVIASDLFATIQELAGATGPSHDGLSLTPLLKNPQGKLSRSEMFFHYPHYYATTTPVSAIRDGDWKLVHYYEDDKVELYNLASDFGEKTDLSKVETARRDRMLTRLNEWLREAGANFPRKP
ncbi:MAG: sulfatase [Candidatus Solibacter usitatus]|nr:sulfatase [Candidatus Solibacter usitatus]